jgi:hypothetical protein
VLWIVTLVIGVIVVYIALIIIVLIFALAGAALVPKAPAVAGVLFAVILIPTFLWLIIASLQVYLAWALSFAAITLERVDPLKAFGSGFSRVFGRGTYWRSAGVSAAMVGIILVFELIAGGAIAALFYVLKLTIDSAPLAFSAFSGLASAVITPLSFAVVAMYYYDIRIRREGFDLDHLAQMLSNGEPALPTPTT